MPDLLYPYLFGIAATVIVLLAAVWAFIVCYGRALDYARKEERLPLACRWEDLSDRVADLEIEHDRLKDEVRQAASLIEDAERARSWLDEHRLEVEQAEQEYKQLEQARADLIQVGEELAGARERLDSLQQENAKAEFRQHELDERNRSLEERVAEQSAMLEREQTRLEKLRDDLGIAEQHLSEARQQLGDLSEAVAQAQRRLEGLEKEIEELKERRGRLRHEANQLEEETQALGQKAAQLREESAALESRSQHLAAQVRDLVQERKQRDVQLTTAEEGLAELWKPAIRVDEYAEANDALEEHTALENVRAYLKSLGLRFSKRAVYAFHTSLKVARDTPLLVLAGISGTGKSLLPRRYAEAMGMHFLNVPVQPRWDGPQDLLGFFNYLENRYKATDLVRALIQTDPMPRDYVPDDWETAFADDRMLIVLLDEMNLARVEYYFSEFLSRLETRRDIRDLENDADRAKAEIDLDVGRFGGEMATRVFVDTNVLFVGTINEDESKLTLSDMVIDRANVIRFGRPSSLTLEPSEGDGVVSKARARSFLPKDRWNDWIRDNANNPIDGEVEEWIAKLNDSLADIGRPFGFRTPNAIRSYLRQYPDQSSEGKRLAFADQIEQRVLPRLRGVDVAEEEGQRALEGVKQLIRQLEDRPLLRAIEQGMGSHGGHLFTWYGVERPDDE